MWLYKIMPLIYSNVCFMDKGSFVTYIQIVHLVHTHTHTQHRGEEGERKRKHVQHLSSCYLAICSTPLLKHHRIQERERERDR